MTDKKKLLASKTQAGDQTKVKFTPELITAITEVVQSARGQVKQVVNQAMVQAYWEIGRLIVEDEQKGQTRAEYGK